VDDGLSELSVPGTGRKFSKMDAFLTFGLFSFRTAQAFREGIFTMAAEPEQPETLNTDEWMSKGDAARARGVSRQAIWELVNRGRLTTCRFKGRVYVSRAEVFGFAPRPRGLKESGYVRIKTVRPKKKKLDPTKWIYIVEAATETGLPRLAIVDLVRRGRIRKIVSAGKTFVSRAGIAEFMRQKRAPEPRKHTKKK
jgi:hypothetical protein